MGAGDLGPGQAETAFTAREVVQRSLKCRRIEVESSSRMSLRRVCMSAREWREHERGSR